jgi:hypothetical protein
MLYVLCFGRKCGSVNTSERRITTHFEPIDKDGLEYRGKTDCDVVRMLPVSQSECGSLTLSFSVQ